MKFLLNVLFISLLASCAGNKYFQVHTLAPDKALIMGDSIVFEDDYLKVSYNIWSPFGEMNFSLYNKTNSDIIIHLENTFFILNGEAFPYFKDRSFSREYGQTISTREERDIYRTPGAEKHSPFLNPRITQITSERINNGVVYNEQPSIRIPPKTRRSISEFAITTKRFVDCNLEKYPEEEKPSLIVFDANASPFLISNIISYSCLGDTLQTTNKFYVEQVGNYKYRDLITTLDTTKCGNPLSKPKKVFKETPPNKYYISYN